MISVIVPVYNVEKYLEKCIESIIQQTYTDLEILLIDDGSKDNSGTICDSYEQEDNRIRTFHKENGGLSDARNYGMQKAQGEYIAFIDSDDYIHPDMFSILMKNLKDNDADISTCLFQKVSEDEMIQNQRMYEYETKVFNPSQAMGHLYLVSVISCNKLYKKELFSDIAYPIGRLHEDEFIFHRVLYRCKQIVSCDCALYYYVQRGGSIMNQKSVKSVQDAIDAFEDRMQFIDYHNWVEVKYIVQREYLYYLMKQYYSFMQRPEQNVKEAKYILKKARKIVSDSKNEKIQQEFGRFCKSPWFYRSYGRLSEIKKKIMNR